MRGAFTTFGYDASPSHLHTAFVGQRWDDTSGSYLLGNGRRAHDPILMRFRSPDALSPMGAGGINAYAYCANDPVNRVDPSGQASVRRVPSSQSMIPQSEPPGALARHYSARGASAVGSLAGASMAFVEIAGEHMQLQPNGRVPYLQRLRRIAGFYALSTPAVADFMELFLPPAAASRAGPVDNLGLASAAFFMAEAGIALASTVRAQGWSGLVPTARSTLYALGEVTLIGPSRDLLADASDWAWPRVYNYFFSARGRQDPPAITVAVIRGNASNHR